MLCQSAAWRPLQVLPPLPPLGVRIATYNVMNLDDRKPNRQKHHLAATILRSQASLVAFQEVQSVAVLAEFLSQYLPDDFPHFVHATGNDVRGMGISLVSRYPLHNVREHPELGFQRDLLSAEVELPGETLRVFTTHLKSKRGGPDADLQRHQEARLICQLLQEERAFLLCGDFNDVPGSECLRILLEECQPQLFSAADRLPARRRATWPTHKAKRQLDFILGPESLHRRLLDCQVLNEPKASDHCLLVAEFAFCRGQE